MDKGLGEWDGGDAVERGVGSGFRGGRQDTVMGRAVRKWLGAAWAGNSGSWVEALL